MGDCINSSGFGDTTVFVFLLLSVYIVVSTLICNMKLRQQQHLLNSDHSTECVLSYIWRKCRISQEIEIRTEHI